MDDLSQFFLVLGRFVTILFWTICHKSYLSQFVLDDLSPICHINDMWKKKEQ